MLELVFVFACLGIFIWGITRLARDRVGHARVRDMAKLAEQGQYAETRQAELPQGKDRAIGLCVQAQAAYLEDDLDGALALLDEALGLEDSLKGSDQLAAQLKAAILLAAGRYDDAIAAAFAHARTEWAEDLRAQIAVARGETSLAEALLGREHQLYTDDAIRLLRLSSLRLDQGAWQEADRLAAQALEYLTRPRERLVAPIAGAFLLRAEITLTAGAPDVARAHYDATLAEARGLKDDDRPGHAMFAARVAAVGARLGETATAERLLDRAEELGTHHVRPPVAAALTAGRGELALAQGDSEEGRTLITRAIELYEELGQKPAAARLRSRLASLG